MSFDLQRAGIWKWASAALFDAIIISIVAVGFAFILSAVTGYDKYGDAFDAACEKYETQYGIKFDITQDEYEALSTDGQAVYDEAFDALNNDADATSAFSMSVSLTLLITSISILLSLAGLEFVVPLFLGNGQTLGKKIFGVCLVRPDGVAVSPVVMFIRTFLGKYTLETMIPVLIIIMIYFNLAGLTGTVVLGLILLLQIILISATRNNCLIHDLLANTAAVDMASQMIFKNGDERAAYVARLAADRAAREPY